MVDRPETAATSSSGVLTPAGSAALGRYALFLNQKKRSSDSQSIYTTQRVNNVFFFFNCHGIHHCGDEDNMSITEITYRHAED